MPHPNLRRSKRSKRPNNNIYGGKGGGHTCTSSDSFIHSPEWNDLKQNVTSSDHLSFMIAISQDKDPFSDVFDTIYPMLLSSKVNSADTHTYHQAMSGHDRDGYSDAMDAEIHTLKDKMNTWDIVTRTKDMHVLPSTWTFRCNRYPDGLIRKLKARFCVRGDRQIEGVDYFETFAPVVQWATVRLLLIISIHLNLSTLQVDYTSAFLHADIEDKVYVEMPRGYKDQGKFLKLNKSLYGLKQNPRNFFLNPKSKLETLEVV